MRAGISTEREREWSAGMLALVLVVALPVLIQQGRSQSFYLDEFFVLYERRVAQPSTLFEHWFGHWVTLPALAYAALYQVFRIRNYLPYQILGIAGHYLVVAVAWQVARRLGVRGWIATATMIPLVVLGSGRPNILFGFQITLTAALGFGLVHLLLATHSGGWSRRDFAGIACGLIALMCSGVGVATAVGVGVAVLVARGWRAALGHVAPLATAFLAWWALAPNRGDDEQAGRTVSLDALRFAIDMAKHALGGLGHLEVAAVGAVLVAGVGVAAILLADPRDRRAIGLVAGLAASAVAFVSITAASRVELLGAAGAREQRYVHILVALLLPIVAAGVEAMRRRSAWLTPVALLPLAVGVPANFAALDDKVPPNELAAYVQSEHLDAALPDRNLHPLFPVPVADVQDAATNPGEWASVFVEPADQLLADALLVVNQVAAPTPSPRCEVVPARTIRAQPGQELLFRGTISVTGHRGGLTTGQIWYVDSGGAALLPTGAMTLTIAGFGPDDGLLDC